MCWRPVAVVAFSWKSVKAMRKELVELAKKELGRECVEIRIRGLGKGAGGLSKREMVRGVVSLKIVEARVVCR